MNILKKVVFTLTLIIPTFCSAQVKQLSNYIHFNAQQLDSITKWGKLKELKDKVKTEEDKFYFKLAEAAVLNSDNKVGEAVSLYYEAITISENLKNDSLKGVAFAKLGSMYMFRDNLAKALLNINEALKFLPENRNDSNYVTIYMRKALIFSFLDQTKEYPVTTKWLLAAAPIQPSKILESNIYNTVGNCFLELNLPDSALYYFQKSLSIRERINNSPWIGQSYNNIGTSYFNKENYNAALKYFQQGLVSRMKGKSTFSGIIESYINIGKTYNKLHNTSLANTYLNKAFLFADSTGNLPLKQRAAVVLKDIYYTKGDFKKAMEYQDIFSAINDSMFSNSKKEELINLAYDFETDQKLKADSLKRIQAEIAVKFEQEKQEAISKRTTIIITLLILFLAVVAFFAYTFFKSNKEKQKQNELITNQHHQLQVKQTEINDSINYAKNIQNALLPSHTIFMDRKKDYYIYFDPKDVVSGDFYWATTLKNEHHDLFIYITADCTGHGVPGAFMSLICITFLNEIVNEKKITTPHTILNTLRKKIIHTLGGESQDGLDGVLCVVNNKTNELNFSGGNGRFFIAHKNQSRVVEYKTDKMPIGKSPHQETSFTTNTVQLNQGDTIYTFTDGFADQFGGPQNKKLKVKNVEKKINSLIEDNLKTQGEELKKFFNDWRSGNEQLDDVTLILLRV